MPDPEQSQQPHKPEAVKDQGCPVEMYDGRRCGRPIYDAPSGLDEKPVCLMHSRDPNKDDAEFRAEFERILDVAREGVADFTGFVFASACYTRREFKPECIFRGATFTQAAVFSDATFAQAADFRRATFTQDANFRGATFMQEADFREATFTQDACFLEATFKQRANFWHASFTQAAFFASATFMRAAKFSDAEFMRDAIFWLATFTQAADFRGAGFKQGAGFQAASFLEAAMFRETRFREDKERLPGPVFSLAQFERPEAVTFYKTYLGQALFHNCDVSKFVFSTVRWRRRSNGKSMVFEEYVDLKHDAADALKPEQNSADEQNYGLIAELYQQLKGNYDDRRDYWTAGDFHYGEMEMKRLACPRLTWLAWLEAKLSGKPRLRKLGEQCTKLQSNVWLLSKLRWWHQRMGLAAWYRRASDYGESWGKPLLWLGVILLLFAALYPFVGLKLAATKAPPLSATSIQIQTSSPQAADLRYWNHEHPGRLFWHSLMTSLGVAAFQRDLAYEPTYPWGRVLALLELLLTSTLIALFLLAVRRQFRR